MKPDVKIISSAEKGIGRLEKLSKDWTAPDNVRVGLPKNSNAYPDGTSVILVGAVNEFGSEKLNIPARSFLRKTVTIKRREYRRLFAKLAKRMTADKLGMREALGLIGLAVQGDVQRRMSTGIPPKLKSRDGTALVDTGHLRRSITFEITED